MTAVQSRPKYQREYPRVPTALPTEIGLGDGGVIFAQTVNISRAGLQLSSDRVTRDVVFPNGQPTSPSERLEVNLRVRLNFDKESPIWISVRCLGVMFRRKGEDEYHLGMQFVEFEDDGYRVLERFIDSHTPDH